MVRTAWLTAVITPFNAATMVLSPLILSACLFVVPISHLGYMPTGSGNLESASFAYYSCRNVKDVLRIQVAQGIQLTVPGLHTERMAYYYSGLGEHHFGTPTVSKGWHNCPTVIREFFS